MDMQTGGQTDYREEIPKYACQGSTSMKYSKFTAAEIYWQQCEEPEHQ